MKCCTECKKYVAKIFDEMYIKEDLVYNKHTNALIGFANLGETNTHLLTFQKSLQDNVGFHGTWALFMTEIPLCTIPMFQGHRRFTF